MRHSHQTYFIVNFVHSTIFFTNSKEMLKHYDLPIIFTVTENSCTSFYRIPSSEKHNS